MEFAEEQIGQWIRKTVVPGQVWSIEMTQSEGVTPQLGYKSRRKFFVILGIDALGNVYGGVVINSRVNSNLPRSITALHMPLSQQRNSFLSYNSFVNCAELKEIKAQRFLQAEMIGNVHDEDFELIKTTIIDSELETEEHLRTFGLI